MVVNIGSRQNPQICDSQFSCGKKSFAFKTGRKVYKLDKSGTGSLQPCQEDIPARAVKMTAPPSLTFTTISPNAGMH